MSMLFRKKIICQNIELNKTFGTWSIIVRSDSNSVETNLDITSNRKEYN